MLWYSDKIYPLFFLIKLICRFLLQMGTILKVKRGSMNNDIATDELVLSPANQDVWLF